MTDADRRAILALIEDAKHRAAGLLAAAKADGSAAGAKATEAEGFRILQLAERASDALDRQR